MTGVVGDRRPARANGPAPVRPGLDPDVVRPGPGDDEQVDPGTVDSLAEVAGRRLTRRITDQRAAGGGPLRYDDERVLGHQVISDVLAEWRQQAYSENRRPLRAEVERALARQVHDRLYGLGRLQPLIDDPDVVDIHCGGHGDVWVHRTDGTKSRVPPVADSDEDLVEMIRSYARRVGRSERRWDKEEVALDLQLPDGSRLHALHEVTGRPVVDIRCHDFVELSRLTQLEARGMVDTALRAFLEAAVRARTNLVVAGGKGLGKTTLLRCLLNEVAPDERIITIEDALELGIERFAALHPDVESIESRPANSEGKGAFTMADGVYQALRMRGRVVVGETRGDEVVPMLKAMSSGNDGSMSTIHAMSSANVFDRLQMYAAMAGDRGFQPEVTAMLVANAVHFVVHLAWDGGRPSRRRVRSVREVVGFEGHRVVSNEVWAPDRWGRAVPAARLTSASEELLAGAGFDLGLCDRSEGWWT